MSAGQRLPGTPIPMHTWSGAGGLTIAGDTWGDPDGPLVVLQHGGGQTRHAWKGAGETLGRAGYHAVAFDARGHGDSGWAPADEYGHDYTVKDLICVVGALGGRRPILVGASMGGGVSLIAIGESHLEAAALVLVDMAPQIEAEGSRRIQAFIIKSQRASTLCKRWRMPSPTTSRIDPDRGCSMASPRMCASAPMANITGTGILPGAAPGAIGRPTGSGCTRVRTISTCQRSWSGVASLTC